MWSWLQLHSPTILISLGLLAVVSLIILKMVRDRKRGASCHCGCDGCDVCPKQKSHEASLANGPKG